MSLSLLIIKMGKAWPGGLTVLFSPVAVRVPTPPSSPSPSSSSHPTLAAPTRRHAAATWQRLFAGGWKKKVLHCFAAFHSSCLKVPASKGAEDGFLSFFFLSCSPPIFLSICLPMQAFAINCAYTSGKARPICTV